MEVLRLTWNQSELFKADHVWPVYSSLCQHLPHKGSPCKVFPSQFQSEVSISGMIRCCWETWLYPVPAVYLLCSSISVILSVTPEPHITEITTAPLFCVQVTLSETTTGRKIGKVLLFLLFPANITCSFRASPLKYPAILPIFQATPKDNQMPSSRWV